MFVNFVWKVVLLHTITPKMNTKYVLYTADVNDS